jgi:membrane-associated phospholipid phosphatase
MAELTLTNARPNAARRPNSSGLVVWISAAALFLCGVVWCYADGISLSPRYAVGFIEIYALVALAGRLIGALPYVSRLGPCVEGLSQLWLAAGALALIQYPMARTALPLVDSWLVSFDHALGFNWPTHYAWVAVHPLTLKMLQLTYGSYMVMAPIFVLTVGLYCKDRMEHCILANLLAGVICAVLAMLFPAVGASGYFLPPDHMPGFVKVFLQARAGIQFLDIRHMEGIEQFPSYHAVMGVIYAFGFAGLPKPLAVPLVAFEIVLVISALAIGGHHLADVLAGMMIAAAVLAVTNIRR